MRVGNFGFLPAASALKYFFSILAVLMIDDFFAIDWYLE